MTSKFAGFQPSLLDFLQELADNNNREWFQINKSRYESWVLEPALAFIEAMAGPLEKISPHFHALAKRSGGSLMRVYRDTRFSRDKTPYKTNVGIQFRHALGKDVHAPGYYFHVDPYEVFLGVGIWHPAPEALKALRAALTARPADWHAATSNRRFREHFMLAGASLSRPPKGYDKEHPLIEDLKRKDFVGVCQLGHDTLLGSDVVASVARRYQAATAFMRFVCSALDVPF